MSSNINSLTVALLVVAASVGFGAQPSSGADDYPAKPIRIVVGFAAGGAPDTIARVIGEKLSQSWGQPVIVENRTGAQGNTAMAAVAKAAADGYTLALVPVGNAAVNPSLFPNLPYDTVRDFAPITQLATFENVLVIGAQSPIRTVKELIALGRSKTVNLSYATPGAGSLAHLAAELLARAGGFEVNHVPYRGVTPALTDVMRGEVTMMFSQVSTAKPLIDDGRLRALATAGRSAQRRPARRADRRRGRRDAGVRGGVVVCADGAGADPGPGRAQAARRRGARSQPAGGEDGVGGAGGKAGGELSRRAGRGDRRRHRALG